MSTPNFKDVIVQDLWVHLAAMIAIAIGLADLWYFHTFARDSDLLFVVGGLAGMGLKIINGSAAALRTAALDTAFTAARAAGVAATSATTAVLAAGANPVPVPPPSSVPPSTPTTGG